MDFWKTTPSNYYSHLIKPLVSCFLALLSTRQTNNINKYMKNYQYGCYFSCGQPSHDGNKIVQGI